jgi:hypothetical protein
VKIKNYFLSKFSFLKIDVDLSGEKLSKIAKILMYLFMVQKIDPAENLAENPADPSEPIVFL